MHHSVIKIIERTRIRCEEIARTHAHCVIEMVMTDCFYSVF